MEDFGDYIYLIAILIVAVSSIFGKKRKQAPDVQSTLPMEDDMPDLDDVIPEYTAYEESERPVYQPISKRNSTISMRNSTIDIPSYETVDDFAVMRVKKQLVSPVKHFVGSELTVSDDHNFNIVELDTVEDVKKAFIYSEIIRRKY